MSKESMTAEIRAWMIEAGENIHEKLKNPLIIEQKTSRNDLVTNVDKETEEFLVGKIRASYPDDQIIGEEGLGDQVASLAGRVWIIDPIDGTLNFIKQQENFCIMLAVFEEGIGQLGFIYNLMKNEFVWGGKDLGVFLNEERVSPMEDTSLEEGIIGVNIAMYGTNKFHLQEIGNASSAVRAIGCAGIEFIELIRGKQVAYLSCLAPWDFAAGYVLTNELGFINTKINGDGLNFLEKSFYVAATPKAYQELQKLVHRE